MSQDDQNLETIAVDLSQFSDLLQTASKNSLYHPDNGYGTNGATSQETGLISYQTNDRLCLHLYRQNDDRKPSKGDLTAFNHKQYWSKRVSDSVCLSKLLTEEGGAIRFGIKTRSNSEINFELCNGSAIDFDCKNESQHLALFDNPYIAKSFLWCATPRYGLEGQYGSRAYYQWSKTLTDVKLCRKINLTLQSLINPDIQTNPNGIDKSVYDPCRLWYGMSVYNPEHIFYQAPETILNIDLIIELIPDWVHDHIDGKITPIRNSFVSLSSQAEPTAQNFCQHLRESIINPQYEGNVLKFIAVIIAEFDRIPPNFHDHNSPGEDAAWEVRGADPVIPSTTNHPDSFAFSEMKDGTYVFHAQKIGIGGDPAKLFQYCKNGENVNRNPTAHEWHESVRELCNYFEIPHPPFMDATATENKTLFFPGWNGSMITTRNNFRIIFGYLIEDLKYAETDECFYRWTEQESGINLWLRMPDNELEAIIDRRFKEDDLALEDKDGNIKSYPLSNSKQRNEAMKSIRLQCRVDEMKPLGSALPLANGVLLLNPDDTHIPKLIPYDRSHNFTTHSEVIYDPCDRPESNDNLQKMLESITANLDVLLYTLAVGLDPKEYMSNHQYTRTIFLTNTHGRSGKDVWKSAYTQIIGDNNLGGVTLNDYDQEQTNPNAIGSTYLYKCLWASETGKMSNSTAKLDEMLALKADIANNQRQFKRLYKNPFLATCYAVMIFNMNSETKYDTGKGAIKDRFAIVEANLYYVDAASFDPSQAHHRVRIPRFATQHFILKNLTTPLLNLLIDWYQKIWNEKYIPDYSYMDEHIQASLKDNHHINRFAEDVGLKVASDFTSSIPLTYLLKLYHAWCIKEELIGGNITGKDWRSLNAKEIEELEDWGCVMDATIDPTYQPAKDDRDPIAAKAPHFENKLSTIFYGKNKKRQALRTDCTKYNRQIITGLSLPWTVEYWDGEPPKK